MGAGLPLLVQDGTANYLYGPGGMLLAQVRADGTAYYYHADRLGSVRALTAGLTDTIERTYSYDAYGSVTASTGTITNPFGYAGEYTDAESGLVYLRARYYDPATPQFLTVDPIVAAAIAPLAPDQKRITKKPKPEGLGFCLVCANPARERPYLGMLRSAL